MKWVYLVNNLVHEILPTYATPPEKWYGPDFAAQCVEALDEVEQGWVYDREMGAFAPSQEPEPPTPQLTTEEAIMEMVTDLDYRTSLLELGIGGTL